MIINKIIENINFNGKPKNYSQIDRYVSRSGQPSAEEFLWLKEQGVTDVINFRTTNEKNIVKNCGMNYHSIPTLPDQPTENNVKIFLNLVNEIINKNGKVHIHCKAGADRTGMYAFIYKTIKGIGTLAENEKEWFKTRHNLKVYPDLIDWAKKIITKL